MISKFAGQEYQGLTNEKKNFLQKWIETISSCQFCNEVLIMHLFAQKHNITSKVVIISAVQTLYIIKGIII